jgi:hypothetical protein
LLLALASTVTLASSPTGLLTIFYYCLMALGAFRPGAKVKVKVKVKVKKLLYDWRFTADQFVFAPSPLRLATRDFIFN